MVLIGLTMMFFAMLVVAVVVGFVIGFVFGAAKYEKPKKTSDLQHLSDRELAAILQNEESTSTFYVLALDILYRRSGRNALDLDLPVVSDEYDLIDENTQSVSQSR
jgi:hypothetical protein